MIRDISLWVAGGTVNLKNIFKGKVQHCGYDCTFQ